MWIRCEVQYINQQHDADRFHMQYLVAEQVTLLVIDWPGAKPV